MKKVTLILLALSVLFISCGTNKIKQETIDINDVVIDTLRVNVIILDGDTIIGTIILDDN